MNEFSAANLRNWDNRAELHSSDTTGSYRIAKVLAGGSSLHALEAGEIGDISGKDIVHLQCHIGLDTISLKHLGAKSATGLDFSPKAIEAARGFAANAGADVRFVEASVFDAAEALGQTYDMVFVTWGAINWLDDIFAWARVVAALLRPNGKLYLLEGHPAMNQFEAREGRLELEFGWRTPVAEPLVFDEAQTYTGDARALTNTRCYEWIHPLSDIVNALIAAGLSIDFLHEHEIVVWKAFPFVVEAGEDQFVLPEGMPKIPMSFSIGATKR
ncbi:class I SAM-dependent methyltransferase [Mesorhizobium sp. WSM2239]|uniref:Class I SAM-dependent methyltransferase n=2 Tax=unclassified Mesorhizobium TaxID=325217 RepID=A0AAU8D9Q4_9HYPH